MSSRAMLIAILIAALPGALHAQSLVEMARSAEEARAKANAEHAKAYTADKAGNKTQTTKVYSDKDLVNVPPPPAVARAQTTTEFTANDTATAPVAGVVRNEDWWRSHALLLQRQRDSDMRALTSARLHYDALPDQAKGILGAPVVGAWMKARAEIARLEAVVATDVQAVKDFEEEARRAGIIPGWLREK